MLFSKNDCALQLAFEPNFLEIEKAKAETNYLTMAEDVTKPSSSNCHSISPLSLIHFDREN